RARDRDRHATVLERPRGILPLALEPDLDARRDHRRQPVGADERRVALVQGDDAITGLDRQPIPVVRDQTAPRAATRHVSASSMRMHTGLPRSDARRGIATSAFVRLRSRARCVRITTGTVVPARRSLWITAAILISNRPRTPAMRARTPGRSSAMKRR